MLAQTSSEFFNVWDTLSDDDYKTLQSYADRLQEFKDSWEFLVAPLELQKIMEDNFVDATVAE